MKERMEKEKENEVSYLEKCTKRGMREIEK